MEKYTHTSEHVTFQFTMEEFMCKLGIADVKVGQAHRLPLEVFIDWSDHDVRVVF